MPTEMHVGQAVNCCLLHTNFYTYNYRQVFRLLKLPLQQTSCSVSKWLWMIFSSSQKNEDMVDREHRNIHTLEQLRHGAAATRLLTLTLIE